MNSWPFCVACIATLMATVPFSAVAQLPSGPPTLENLLQEGGDAQSPPPTATGVSKPPAPAGERAMGRPQQLLIRPKDAVRHASLDAAWEKYGNEMKEVTDECRKLIQAKLEQAKERENLDAALKWDAAMKALVSSQAIPTDREFATEREQLRKMNDAARKALGDVYDSLKKQFTKDGSLDVAEAVRDEWVAVSSAADAGATGGQGDKSKEVEGGEKEAKREIVLKIRVTSDWGQVAVLPADAVTFQTQESRKGPKSWEVNANTIKFVGTLGKASDAEVHVTYRLAATANKISLVTQKGDIGSVVVDVQHIGKTLKRCANEGNHGGDARKSQMCRQEFQINLPQKGAAEIALDGDEAFQPEQLLARCQAPIDIKARLTPVDELPVDLLGMWWLFAKRGAAGGAEIVPDRLRRFASFLITARSWQVANPGQEMAPQKFRLIGRLADVEGLPTHLVILSDDMHWIIHGPVAGRWVLLRAFGEDNTESDRQVFELKK